LSDGRLFVHSPTRLDPETRAKLDELGPVAFVASPNKIHNQAIGEYAQAFPEARILASPGLPERRPELRFDAVLGDKPDPAWEADLDQALTAGNCFFSEVVFLHRASKTLIVADLVENITRDTVDAVTRIFLKAFRVYERPVASPDFRMFTDDADAAERSFERILAWDFDRIILAHGTLIESDAKAVLRRVCEELCDEVRKRSATRRRMYGWVARRQ